MKLKDLILRNLKFFAWLAVYNSLADLSGGINLDYGQFYFELPLVFITANLLYYTIHNHIKLPTFWSLFPIFAYYAFVDIYYINVGRVFKWVEVSDLPLMIDVMPVLGVFTLFVATITLVWLLAKTINFKNWIKVAIAAIPIASFASFSLSFPETYTDFFETYARKINIDEKSTTGQNGRLVTPLYFEAKRLASVNLLPNNPGWAQTDTANIAAELSKVDKRNIHIIVMESWVDPALFQKLPIGEELQPSFFKQHIEYRNVSVSPVFGGQTPQAEFEILCNTKTEQLLGTIEFNFFSGAATSCLPNWLSASGWRTIASHAYKPTFFNRGNAYPSIGFNEVYFPEDYTGRSDSYLKAGLLKNEPYMFDGDFLQANLEFLQSVSDQGPPILNYVLGVFGHWPNQVNLERFPDPELPSNTNSFDQVNRIINQYYYRTGALANYLEELMLLDPNGLILVISDHLPPFPGISDWQTELGYFENEKEGKYKNIFYFWDAGKPVRTDEMHHYEMANLIIESLNGRDCQQQSEEACINIQQDGRYINVLAAAVR